MIPVLAAATGKVATLPDVSIGHSLLQMVIALAVVVACIWGLSKVLARLRGGAPAAGRRQGRQGGGGLEVVGRQSLGKDLSIATVRWGGREVLVGISGSTITFLSEPGSGTPLEEGSAAQPARQPHALPAPRELARPAQGTLLETLRDATLRR